MAQSKTKYKYDLNIVCGCDEDQEPNKVVELREYLVSRHNFKIYGKPQHEVGKTIFKTHGIGIEDCRYTILWMTKDDYKDDPVQTYYRQNALARLTDAEPKPNGTERMLILLEGISRNDYLANNPEFKQFNVQSINVDLDWKQEIEKVLKDREVFCHDDKQPSNTESRNLTDDQLRHAADCAADSAACADSVEKYVRSTHPSNDHRPTLNREDSGCSTATDSFQCSEMALSLSRESLPQAALDGTRFSYNSGMIPTPGNLAVMDWNSTQVPCQQQDHEESSPPAVLEQMKTQREQMKTQREQIQELEGTIKQMEKERAMEKEQQEKEQALEREQVSRLLQHHSEVDSVQVSSIVQNNEIVLCNNTMKKPEDLKEMPDQSNEGNKGILPAVVGFVQNVCNTFLTG